jgi:hypothetical protein
MFLQLVTTMCLCAITTQSAIAQRGKSYASAFRGNVRGPVLTDPYISTSAFMWSKWASGVTMVHMTILPISIEHKWLEPDDFRKAQQDYLRRLQECSLFARLIGPDEFPYGDAQLTMTLEVDKEGAADMDGVGRLRMTESEYLNFVRRGYWQLSFSCPGQ